MAVIALCFAGKNHGRAIFSRKNEGQIHGAMRGAGREAFKRAGIENFRRHDLRHAGASWHRQSGMPTHELQRLGRWRSSVMVERYAHLAPDDLAQAPNRLDRLLGGYDLATPLKQ
jgi:integrase